MMNTGKPFTIDQLLDGLGPIIFESIKIPFGIIDKHHRVLWANAALAALHRVSAEELIGNICHQVCHRRSEPCPDCPTQTVFQTGKTRIVEKWYEFPGRGKTWGEVHYYPIRANDGEVAAIILFGFDVTDSKNRIEVLRTYSKYLSDKLDVRSDKDHAVESHNGEIKFTVRLSVREIEILRLMTGGYTNVQIASLLSISANTVKTHVTSIFNKLGVNDRTQAAVIATRHNMV